MYEKTKTETQMNQKMNDMKIIDVNWSKIIERNRKKIIVNVFVTSINLTLKLSIVKSQTIFIFINFFEKMSNLQSRKITKKTMTNKIKFASSKKNVTFTHSVNKKSLKKKL